MRAKLRFWVTGGQRWLRMTLTGEGWPEAWSVPYSYLDSWGMLSWFASPPAEAEGLRAGVNYRMSDTPTLPEFATFLNNLHTLIGEIKPEQEPDIAMEIIDERDYD